MQGIYEIAAIVSVGKDQCNELIFDYHSKYMDLVGKSKSLNSSQDYQNKIKKFTDHMKILFDFSEFKCT